MTLDIFMNGIVPIIIGVLILVFRQPYTEQIVRQQTAIWRDWRWGAKNRPFISSLVNTCGVLFILLGVLCFARIWR